MRGLGKGIREFKNATSDIQEEINKSVRTIEKDVNLKDRPNQANKDPQKDTTPDDKKDKS